MRKPHQPPDYVVVGEVVRPHGVRGEVKVVPVDTSPERLLELTHVYVARPGHGGERRRRLAVRRARIDRGAVLMSLEGIDTRDAAASLRGGLVEIPGAWVKPLPEGRFYVFELVGCRVETVNGRTLGTVTDVLSTGANDVYVVAGPWAREILIPAVKAMVKEVDVVRKRIVVDPWPGLLPADEDEDD